jgi:hypothetical protein|tara:strand:+ start:83 stop:250 length:168 start_codon:yes stop_codon:yes gene_type:complete
MKRLMQLLLFNKIAAKILQYPLLKLHTLAYKLSGVFSSILNNGVHPKHKIMKYKE